MSDNTSKETNSNAIQAPRTESPLEKPTSSPLHKRTTRSSNYNKIGVGKRSDKSIASTNSDSIIPTRKKNSVEGRTTPRTIPKKRNIESNTTPKKRVNLGIIPQKKHIVEGINTPKKCNIETHTTPKKGSIEGITTPKKRMQLSATKWNTVTIQDHPTRTLI